MKRIAIIAALAVVVLAAVWFVSRPEPVPVTLVTAERGPVAATVANTRAGTVDACRRAGLSPALGGQIASLPVKDGERVEAGALLLELWNDDLKAELTLSERDARASRSRAREACVVADVAKRDAARSMNLRADGLVSEEAADQAEGAFAVDRGRVHGGRGRDARRRRTRRRHESASRAHSAPRAIRRRDRGDQRRARRVRHTLARRHTDAADRGSDRRVLPVHQRADRRGRRAARPRRPARPHQPRRISRAATFPGHVRRVAPYVLDQEKQARTVEIEAEFDDPEEAGLLAGYSADVEVILEERADALRLPTSVILPGKTVYVLRRSDGNARVAHRSRPASRTGSSRRSCAVSRAAIES